ncbi:MAG TPA: Maf family protein [Flavobacterium sp.]|nr:Maf family protein [Flavobacterium sp.]
MAISKIEGSYTNVVGLPTDLVYDYLSNFNSTK